MSENQTARKTHTPGPWRWNHFPDNESYLEDSHSASVIEGSIVTADNEEREANARLIAAAPDLLEAARYVIEDAVSDMPATARVTKISLDALRAAIAKAEGRA